MAFLALVVVVTLVGARLLSAESNTERDEKTRQEQTDAAYEDCLASVQVKWAEWSKDGKTLPEGVYDEYMSDRQACVTEHANTTRER